jgi:outer membrane protein assembly factor BamB
MTGSQARRVVGLLALVLTTAAARGDDWPQWLGPKRDGVWREDGVLEKFPPGGPKKVWAVPLGGGYAGPAVAGGKVFVQDRRLATGATEPGNPFDRKSVKGSERLLCLDAATGKEVWKYEYPSEYAISYAAGPRCTNGRPRCRALAGARRCRRSSTNPTSPWRASS